MQRSAVKRISAAFTLCVLGLTAAGLMTGCGSGGGSGGNDGATSAYNQRTVNLYTEVPVIEVQGNPIERDATGTYPGSIVYTEPRSFVPGTLRSAELYDSNKDGIDDAPMNAFQSLCNASNRLLDFELASCVAVSGTGPDYVKQTGYADTMVWADDWRKLAGVNQYVYQHPDTMPATANATGTNGTQFIVLTIPFEFDSTSFFDTTASGSDFVNTDYLTIEDESGNHVNAMVLINGKDKDGVSHPLPTDPYWSQLSGLVLNAGAGKTTVVFVAQDNVDEVDQVPDQEPFNVWASSNEIRIHFKQAKSLSGDTIQVNSRWFILKEGGTPVAPTIESITATNAAVDGSGQIILDPLGNYPLVQQDSMFLVTFDKPVIPETVGQSIVFNGAPFNGNTGPLPTRLAVNPPSPDKNPCANNGTFYDPIVPNVSILAELIYSDGTASGTKAIIPFRCHPLHQNNLSTYVLNPIIDLPGSSELGNPPFNDPLVTDFTRIRLTVNVYDHDANDVTSRAIEQAPPAPPRIFPGPTWVRSIISAPPSWPIPTPARITCT